MTPTPDESLDTLALACIPGLGPKKTRQLLAAHPVVRDALLEGAGSPEAAERALQTAQSVRARCTARDVAVVVVTEDRYPAPLRDLEDAPVALFALGSLACALPPTVAIVGSRQATSYGRHVARDFARALASRGICVVSGLAVGIDAEAHAGALAGGGPTIAVQGTGVDVPYPRANTTLHAAVASHGLVLSELPPGRLAHPGAFPRRNRLIAALADVIVVVEAGPKSGALITAQLGFALHRIVAAVPGPIGIGSSLGANLLLRDGAQIITAFDDVVSLLGLTRRGRDAMRGGMVETNPTLDAPSAGVAAAGPDWSRVAPPDVAAAGGSRAAHAASGDAAMGFAPDSAEGRLLAVLAHGPQFPDELLRACTLSPRDVGIAISTLTLHGAVACDPAGLVRRNDATLRFAP